jgi:hypothetical protein
VKAHSGLIHNEIADTLATRGVKGGSYCPVSYYDVLPADTETEDDPNIPQTEVITQTDEFGADEEHLPEFGIWVKSWGLNVEEGAERAEERERSIRQFAHDQLGNSTAPTSEDEDAPQPGEVPVIKSGWSAVEGPSQDMNLSELEWGKQIESETPQEQTQANECYIRVRRGIGEEDEATDARSAWSNSWAQAQAEAHYVREMEERFSWMKEADKGMLSLGLEPYPAEHFAEAMAHTGETQSMVFEQCANGEEVLREDCPEGAEEVVGISFVIRSRTCVTVTNSICYSAEASQHTAKLLTQLAELLPEGAQVDMIFASDPILSALNACADILAQGLDVDYYCQDPDWKSVIESWRNKHIQASCRKEDAEGLDAENLSFLNLALQEVRQTVTEEIQAWMMGVAAMAEMDQ